MTGPRFLGRAMRVPFHPFLLAMFPVIFLLAENINELPAQEAGLPLLVILAGTTAALFALSALLKDFEKAAVSVSVLVFIFFSYGPLQGVLEGRTVLGLDVARDRFLLPLWLGLGGATLFVVVRARRSLARVTSALNVTSLTLIALNLSALLVYATSKGGSAEPINLPISDTARAGLPDIYYIVPERYGSKAALKEHFDLDIGEFHNFLEQKGFYVAESSTSNYGNTAHSLASSLNMSYLEELTSHIERPSEDFEPIFDLIRNNRVAGFLKERGYQYINLGSWYLPTASSPIADINLTYDGSGNFGRFFGSEFHRILYRTTLAWTASRHLGIGTDDLDPRRRHYGHSLWQFEELERARDLPGPKFVFAHLSISHDPYVFDQRGWFVPESRAEGWSYERKYSEQLQFTNTLLTNLIDHLLGGPESNHPIIVLQGDEGPFTAEGVKNPNRFAGREPTPEEVRTDSRKRYPILNAIYLPGMEYQHYPATTPVNNFRILLNQLFQTNLDLLPDENYAWSAGDMYTFKDRTSFVNDLSGDASAGQPP